MEISYIRGKNNKIYAIKRHIPSLKCRQRCRLMDGTKVEPLKFVSYNVANEYFKKNKVSQIIDFYTISKI
tara:strand:- start:439 stop:648 length:210 start_codon:yes stop_codon:yes gene_type:complete